MFSHLLLSLLWSHLDWLLSRALSECGLSKSLLSSYLGMTTRLPHFESNRECLPLHEGICWTINYIFEILCLRSILFNLWICSSFLSFYLLCLLLWLVIHAGEVTKRLLLLQLCDHKIYLLLAHFDSIPSLYYRCLPMLNTGHLLTISAHISIGCAMPAFVQSFSVILDLFAK